MNLSEFKKNRMLRSLALRFRYWREQGSFNCGPNKIINKGVRVHSRIQIKGLGNEVLIELGGGTL